MFTSILKKDIQILTIRINNLKFGLGAIQVLRNAVGGGRCQISLKKPLCKRRCMVQRYQRNERVGGCQISRKKALRNTWMAPYALAITINYDLKDEQNNIYFNVKCRSLYRNIEIWKCVFLFLVMLITFVKLKAKWSTIGNTQSIAVPREVGTPVHKYPICTWSVHHQPPNKTVL